ncbi:MAG: peptidoglycan-associated lipoprotein Pal [Nitrospirota bacterium]|nr:peptidoglycan-associated lipoprotein Pal [Nitrospirota bacterium]
MRRTSALMLSAILLLSLTTLWGCPKKAEVSSAPEEQKQAEPVQSEYEKRKAEEERLAEESRRAEEERKAAEAAEAAKRAEEEAAKERAAKEANSMQPIYFDFDKSFVRSDAKEAMKANAQWMKANPKAKIRIEGNCDERGTIEYNQALGQRRAAAAKKYLTDLGISSKRISLISYGKEKPTCTDATEECWQKNRRDDFVVNE